MFLTETGGRFVKPAERLLTMMLFPIPLSLFRPRFRALGAWLGSVCLATAMMAAEAPKKTFDLAAGDAVATLKAFSAQSGEQVIYPVEQVRGAATNAVRGELTPAAALAQMLANTGLVAKQDAATGATAVSRAAPSPDPKAGARSETPPAARTTLIAADLVKMEALEITGSRVRGLVEGATAQPVLTLTSVEIDRTGAQSIGDVLRYIPQVSAFTTGQANTQASITRNVNQITGATLLGATASAIDATAGRVTATIRGAPAGATLLLIDGRRAPKNNQARSGDGYDLNGIPLSAVERIEVLLDGASSIYGADAMGGVINIILKKNYRGTELRLGYENTFDTDSAVLSGSVSHGFGGGKLRGLITASWEQSNALALRDRAFTASYDRRPFGGADLRDSNTPGGAGRVSRTGTVPLPGLAVTSTAIPAGTNGATLSVADYAGAGAIADPFDLARYADYASTYERYSALAKFDYALRDWLALSLEVRTARNRNFSLPTPIFARNISLPIGYPGNPFGIAVTLNKYFTDLRPERVATSDTNAITLGANGRLPKGWRYDATISRAESHLRSDGDSGLAIDATLFAAAVTAGQRPNLLYDGTRVANPNAPGVIEALTIPARDEEKAQTWTYAFQVDGPVYELPGGDIVTALGAERREEYADFPLRLATDTISARSGSDQVSAYFAEVNVPVFGEKNRRTLLQQLNLSASYRYESYDSGGSAKNPRAGLSWRPLKWLLLRGSYGEGFKIPTLAQRTAPTTITNSNLTATANNLDPLRGNTVNSPIYPTTRGGKADLLPERSENTTFGFVAEVPFVQGLSFSFDWFDNVYNDRVATLLFNQMALLYPQRITRGANLPTDQPGWAGPVTAADLRAINVAFSQITGYDVGVKYDRRTPWGDAQVGLTGSKYTRNSLVPTPGGPASVLVNTDSLPVQINGNAFLYRRAYGFGVLASYRAANRSATDRAVTPAAIRWDAQFNYDFAKAPWLKDRRASWAGRLLGDTKLSLTIFNVFNTEPPLDYSFFPDNTVLDSRLRRYALSLRRQF